MTQRAVQVHFTKMQAQGNDFVIFDCTHLDTAGSLTDADFSLIAKSISHRNFGVGCDQLLVLRNPSSPDIYDIRMDVFNADGSKAEQCANGLRCVAKYFSDSHPLHTNISTSTRLVDIETVSGHAKATVWLTALSLWKYPPLSARVQVNLGKPKSIADSSVELNAVASDGSSRKFACTLVSFGNPHCVIFVDDVEGEDLNKWGPLLENHSSFPSRTNVEFVQAKGENTLQMRVWERGAGETLSCGSGACAGAVASIARNKVPHRQVSVVLPGGSLNLEWSADNEVFVEGPATTVFEGTIRVQLPARN